MPLSKFPETVALDLTNYSRGIFYLNLTLLQIDTIDQGNDHPFYRDRKMEGVYQESKRKTFFLIILPG